MLKGITVKLYQKISSEVDELGNPIATEIPIQVENVLVVPTSSDDVINALNLTGKKAVYTLGIPKGDANEWEDCIVEFFDSKWRVFGFATQGIESLIPLSWNKKVMVERYED